MTAAIFGPRGERHLTPEAMIRLPVDWMTAACMEARFRNRAGWLGLAPCTSDGDAWTCRIAARPGIYGLAPRGPDAEAGAMDFDLFYFPAPDDPMLEFFSMGAAVATCEAPKGWVRDFPAFPELAGHFAVAELKVRVAPGGHGTAIVLEAPERRRVAAAAGIIAPNGSDWLVAPGGSDENLPAMAIGRDLVAVLAAGFAMAAGSPPDATASAGVPRVGRIRLADGALVADPAFVTRLVSEAVIWGEAAPLLARLPDRVWQVGPAEGAWADLCRRVLSPHDEADATLALADRPLLVVLTGFLGSGKTSFLNQFIEYQAARDRLVGVIQNEIGETGVDGKLMEGDDSVLEVDAGCICCTLAGTLGAAVRRLMETVAPEIIVLESTGLANPLNLLDELKGMARQVRLGAVVALADAARFEASLAASDIARDQIAAADVVVLNKCDLVDAGVLKALKMRIAGLNPKARLLETTYGRVPPGLVGTLSRYGGDPAGAPDPSDGHGHHHHDHDRHHDHHHHDGECDCGGMAHVSHLEEGFSHWRLVLPDRVSRSKMMGLLDGCPGEIFRIKGIVTLDDGAGPVAVQWVPGTGGIEPLEKPYDGPSFLIIIGRGLDAEALTAYWAPLGRSVAHVLD